MNLRNAAKGQECQIRIPGVCTHNPETTVLAHIRMAGVSGMGLKSNDLIGAWACSTCHDACDRRTHTYLNADQVRLWHLEGMVRTIDQLAKQGLI